MAVHWMGADVARAIDEKNAKQVDALKARGITPTLGLVRIGERGGDIAYESSLVRYCTARGIRVERFLMPADATQRASTRSESLPARGEKAACTTTPATSTKPAICASKPRINCK